MLKALDEADSQNWASKVRNLLFTYGFGYIRIAQDVGDIGMFISQFQQRLTDCMTQRWHADISESSRCDTYKKLQVIVKCSKVFMHRHTLFLKKSICKISLL